MDSIEENTISATIQLLKDLKVSVTRTTVTETLQEHPDYPSLLSISDSLHRWKINNISLQLEPEKLNDLPVPFIAHLHSTGGLFVTVNKVSGDEIIYADDKKNSKSVIKNRDNFLREWSGVVLVPEATNESGEKDYLIKRRKERLKQSKLPFILISCLLLISGYIISSNLPINYSTIFSSLLLLTKFMGCMVTALLLWHEIDHSNPVLQQICSTGKNINCEAVLQSKTAKIFNWLTWSEIGFFYFTGSFLSMLFAMRYQLSTISLLSWLNLLALPYTIFSVYYQWRIVKQWCTLCLSVQALILIEFVLFYFVYWHPFFTGTIPSFNFHYSLLVTITSFMLPTFFWSFTKTFLSNAKDGEKYKTELNRLKHNTQIFEALLRKQKSITASPDGLGITIGNPDASNSIIKVCNPYCGPCAKAHSEIEAFLKGNDKNNVKVQIIFNATDEEKDPRSNPVKHLMAIYERNDKKAMQKALDDWYLPNKKDYEVFAAKYPINGDLELQTQKLKDMSSWCKDTEIAFTPTFFVNGYQLPAIYSINDLNYFLSV